MKQYLAVLVAINTLIFAGNAFACSVPNTTTAKVRDLIKQQGGWPMSNSRCEFLNKKGLLLTVTASSTVLSGSSVGWAVVSIGDDNNIRSEFSQTSTYVNASTASMNIADELAYTAIKAAIENFDFESAAQQVGTFQKALKGS